MAVDRALLKAPVDQLRVHLSELGISTDPPSVTVLDQFRASWRFDLSSLGLDTTNVDHLAGALAGLVLSGKAQGLPVGYYAMIVRMFDALEPLLDNPTPWESQTDVVTPWGKTPGRDLSALAEALASDVPRFDLSDPESVARLAEGVNAIAEQVSRNAYSRGGSPQLGGPAFPRDDTPAEPEPVPETGWRFFWRSVAAAWRTSRKVTR